MNNLTKLALVAGLSIAGCKVVAQANLEDQQNQCIDDTRKAVEYVIPPEGPVCESIEDAKEGVVWVVRSSMRAEPIRPEPPKPAKAVLPPKPRPKPKPEPKVTPPPPPPELPPIPEQGPGPELEPELELKAAKKTDKEPEAKLDKWHQNVFDHLDTCANYWSLNSNNWLEGLKVLMQDAEELDIPIDLTSINHKIESIEK